MCGRFAVGDPAEQGWDAWLGLGPETDWPAPRWNVAPTDRVAILRAGPSGLTMDAARWGLVPGWWRKPLAQMTASTFNARAEEAAVKPMFRDAWARGRCLVPALGYYEWTGARGAKTPWFISTRGNAPGLCFAGLWAWSRPADVPESGAEGLLSTTILTCPACPATAHLHPRSPVVLAEGNWDAWLSGVAGAELMHAPPDRAVTVWPVDARVGRVGSEGPELIEPAGLPL